MNKKIIEHWSKLLQTSHCHLNSKIDKVHWGMFSISTKLNDKFTLSNSIVASCANNKAYLLYT
jgi:hypothetical protein